MNAIRLTAMLTALVSSWLLCVPHANAVAGRPDKVPASPASALFYPDEVRLTVRERLVPQVLRQGNGFILALPKEAKRPTFFVRVDGQPVSAFYWQDAEVLNVPAPYTPARHRPEKPGLPQKAAFSELEEDDARRILLEQVEHLQAEWEKREAQVRTLAFRLESWEKSVAHAERDLSPESVEALDSSIARNMPDIRISLASEERERDLARIRLEKAREDLAEYDRVETFWYAVVPYAGESPGAEHEVEYSYFMPASCRISYTLDAFPQKESLAVGQNVTLAQTSGLSWDATEIYISTARRGAVMRPARLANWYLHAGSKSYKSVTAEPAPMAPSYQANAVALQSTREADSPPPSPKPVHEEMSTFRLWSLGAQTLESDMPVTLSLAQDEYKAAFHYTLRPHEGRAAFLTAVLDLDVPLELPQGHARFTVDDVFVGESPLSINGNRAVLYFGTDPQVTATVRDMARIQGEKGIISKENSTVWNWEFVVRNTRSRPVDVWLEDLLPQIGDTAVKLAVNSQPKPEEAVTEPAMGSARIYRWRLTLQPGETKTITHNIQATTPADKMLEGSR